jgi:hypothetical protein
VTTLCAQPTTFAKKGGGFGLAADVGNTVASKRGPSAAAYAAKRCAVQNGRLRSGTRARRAVTLEALLHGGELVG